MKLRNLILISVVLFICSQIGLTSYLYANQPTITTKAENSINKPSPEDLLTQIQNQQKQIIALQRSIQGKDIFYDFFYPIILSLLSALIFWIIFSLYPESKRKKEIRIKLNLNLKQIYQNLFAIFDCCLKAHKYSPSMFQDQIQTGTLEKIDIELGLQNKCINESYLYDENVNSELIPIGTQLNDIFTKIDKTIDALYNFSQYLTSDEIHLLENIRSKLKTYEMNPDRDKASKNIGSVLYYPLNPSLAYMATNLFELYHLYVDLQKVVFKIFEGKDLFLGKIQFLFRLEKYTECYNFIIKFENKNKVSEFSEFYKFKCEMELNYSKKAYARLSTILQNKPNLVSSRGFIGNYLSEPTVKSMLDKYYSDAEISEVHKVLEQENDLKNQFIKNNKKLRDYYKAKDAENRKRS